MTQSGAKNGLDPAQLRAVFGQNLRILCAPHGSVAGLCRRLGINRTQFNRYLSGESFPRPDVLHRICTFFDVDARILLEPVNEISSGSGALINHPFLDNHFDKETVHVPEDLFPSGLYRFVRRSFLDEEQFAVGLIRVLREDGFTFLRGYAPRNVFRSQGIRPSLPEREYRGLVIRQDDGVASLASHKHVRSASFHYLTKEKSLQDNVWEGYATRTSRESFNSQRAARMVMEHLGSDTGTILKAARSCGMVSFEEVPSFFGHLLRINQPFR